MPPRIDLTRRPVTPELRVGGNQVKADLSRRNQVKADPYSTKTHKRIDAMLVLVTIALIAFAFHTAAQQRVNSAAPNIDSPKNGFAVANNHAHAAQSQPATSK
jgi:hypothetical protein